MGFTGVGSMLTLSIGTRVRCDLASLVGSYRPLFIRSRLIYLDL
jgi:hypothetical protein